MQIIDAITEYIDELEITNISKETIRAYKNAYISALRRMFNYLIDEEIIKNNPEMSVKLQKAKDTKTIEIFTNDEVRRLVDWNKRSRKFLDVRDNLIISFLLETGCRNHELSYLKESDIHYGFVYFKITKNSKPRVVPVNKLLEKYMRRYNRIKAEYFQKLKKEDSIENFYILSKSGNRMWQQNIGQVVDRVCKDCNISEHKAYPHNDDVKKYGECAFSV